MFVLEGPLLLAIILSISLSHSNSKTEIHVKNKCDQFRMIR